jgi:hypothetical protein
MMEQKVFLTDDDAVHVIKQNLPRPPFTVFVEPAVGCSVRVEMQIGAKWFDWVPGVVAADTYAEVNHAISGVRFTRTAGSGGQTLVGVV